MSPILGIIASGINVVDTSFESIATATGDGSSAFVEFTSIPATYTHLQIRGGGRSTASATTVNINLRINGVTTQGSYKSHYLRSSESAVTTGADGGGATSSIWVGSTPAANYSANVFGANIIDILDYANTNKNKVVRAFNGSNNNTAAFTVLSSGLWIDTAAITGIRLTLSSGNWATNTQFALYGIKGS